MKKTTIETKVADTILERETEITLGGHTYKVAPPVAATIIEVSELISRMPAIKPNQDEIVTETLAFAKDCRVLGDIVAKLILGHGSHIKTVRTEKKQLFGLITRVTETTIDQNTELAKYLLETTSPKKLNEAVIDLLKRLEISDFFGLTTSLIEINLTQRTRAEEVVKRTIASGQ